MNFKRHSMLLAVVTAGAALSGCAAYRVDSNVAAPAATVSAPEQAPVLLAEDNLPGRSYRQIGPVEVSVKKLTMFHANPTKEQAAEALVQRARGMGADAVINVRYDFGVGLTTWGYMDAKGTAVRLLP